MIRVRSTTCGLILAYRGPGRRPPVDMAVENRRSVAFPGRSAFNLRHVQVS